MILTKLYSRDSQPNTAIISYKTSSICKHKDHQQLQELTQEIKKIFKTVNGMEWASTMIMIKMEEVLSVNLSILQISKITTILIIKMKSRQLFKLIIYIYKIIRIRLRTEESMTISIMKIIISQPSKIILTNH